MVEINSYNFASTGKIMLGIAETARQYEFEVFTYSPAGKTQKQNILGNRFIGSRLERRASDCINYFTGNQGGLNYYGTLRLIKELKKIKPDIIHLHNLHSNYVNIEMLFKYITSNQIKVVWTLHDCWAFTGHCPYFDIVQCDKWKVHCGNCAMYKKYPATLFDHSFGQYEKKKNLFSSVKNMTIVTPSKWLADLVSESFLKDCSVRVIFNGIDLTTFYPRTSDFRAKYKIAKDKFVILGVAFSWGIRKGLDRFEKL